MENGHPMTPLNKDPIFCFHYSFGVASQNAWWSCVLHEWGEVTWLMWTCWWSCFCFSMKFWCCCCSMSWASVLCGSGTDCVRFRGRCRGNLERELTDGRSFISRGDEESTGTLLVTERERHVNYTSETRKNTNKNKRKKFNLNYIK